MRLDQSDAHPFPFADMGRQPSAVTRALRNIRRDVDDGYREFNKRRGFPDPQAMGLGGKRPHPWRVKDEAEFREAQDRREERE